MLRLCLRIVCAYVLVQSVLSRSYGGPPNPGTKNRNPEDDFKTNMVGEVVGKLYEKLFSPK